MSTNSQNLGMIKPDYNDDADLSILDTNFGIIDQAIGNLSNLPTNDKTSIVNSIKELNSSNVAVGDLTTLNTVAKSSAVAAINEIAKALNEQEWTASDGQTVFTLTNGTYTPNTKALQVIVGGVPQLTTSYTETSSTSFTLAEALTAGTVVQARWFQGAMPAVLDSALRRDNNGVYSIGSRSFITEINGDFYLAANATFDGTNWNRIDTTKTSFLLQLQGENNIPGETNTQGVNLWRCVPGNNPIGQTWTAVGSWEPCFLFTSNSNFVVSGMNFEIDGSASSTEYGRINQLADGTYFSRNCYYDGNNFIRDDVTKGAIAIRIKDTGIVELLTCGQGSSTPIPYGQPQPSIVWNPPQQLWNDTTTSNRSAVKYTINASQSLTASTFTPVQYTNKIYDNLNEFNTSTYTFTAQKAGIYLISAMVSFSSPTVATRAILTVSKNGSEDTRLADMSVPSGKQFAVSGSAQIELNANDTLVLNAYVDNALSTVAGTIIGHLEITKIA